MKRALLVSLLCAGCASDRYLTEEEDAALRARCEPWGGCTLIPNPVWEEILRWMKSVIRM